MTSPWFSARLLAAIVLAGATCFAIGCDLSVSWLSSPLGATGTLSGRKAVPDGDTDGSAEDEKPELPPAEDLVKDWAKPDITLFVTGRQHGYIEPCGCTGLENQKGGLMRRHSVQKLLLDRGWDLVSIDAGNQIRRFGQQPVIKIQKTYEALCKSMNYDVINFGPDDLKIPTIELLQTMINAPTSGDSPFTCANVLLFGDESQSHQFRVIEKNGKRIGITSVFGDEHFEVLQNQDDLTLVDMKEALQKVVPQMLAQKCDFMVLIGQTSEENGIALAKQFPVFDLLITTSGAGDPWLHPQQVQVGDRTTQMIQVGVKGMYVGLVGLYFGTEGKRVEYERVALDHRFKDSPEMMQLFANYQKELEALYISNANQDIRPRPHPSGHQFVGSESCAECHDEEYDIWAEGVELDGEGPHFKATADIIKPPNNRGAIARNFDPECISCHVTGWNPQNFYPYQTGYIDVKKDALLHGNGCENCHGPGSAHIQAEKDDKDENRMEAMRLAMRLTLAQAKAQACMECHDIDNSPDFAEDGAFEKYWAQIKHGD